MGLFDKAKSFAQPSLQDMADKQAPEIAHRIVSQLGPLLDKAAHAIDDDSKFLSYVATPLFRALPPMIQMIGRERIKWDPIMFDMRNYVLTRSGTEIQMRPDSMPVVLAILRKHFAGQHSELLASIELGRNPTAASSSDSAAHEQKVF